MKNKTSALILMIAYTTLSIYWQLIGNTAKAQTDIIIASILLAVAFILSQMEGKDLLFATSPNNDFDKVCPHCKRRMDKTEFDIHVCSEKVIAEKLGKPSQES